MLAWEEDTWIRRMPSLLHGWLSAAMLVFAGVENSRLRAVALRAEGSIVRGGAERCSVERGDKEARDGLVEAVEE